MLLTFDTETGAFSSSVLNYVEGNGEFIEIVLPLHPEYRACYIEKSISQVAQFVQENLHDLYAVIDQMKGKELRSALVSTQQLKEAQWEEMAATLAVAGDDADGTFANELGALHQDLNHLGVLLSSKKRQIKERLKLVSVEIDPESPKVNLFFGVDEINFPVLTVQGCDFEV